MNRKLRNTSPILPQDLKLRVPDYSMLHSSEKQHRHVQNYNRHGAHITPLKEGMTVWISDHYSGKVITQVGPQSYPVRTSAGVLRRNRHYLIASSKEQFDDEETDLDSLPDLSNDDPLEAPDEPLQPTHDIIVYKRSG